MKARNIWAALLLIVAGLQVARAQQQQGMKVWRNGKFSGFIISQVDSVQFVNLATGVTLSQDEMAMEIGERKQLTATVIPDNVDEKVRWESSDTDIASVDEDGWVSALHTGTCTIKCHVIDGVNIETECQVTVGNVENLFVTCAEAAELANALDDNATSIETYTVTGYITEILGAVSRRIFWMADTKDGGRVFEAYYARLPEGVTEFEVGMRISITGKLYKYVSSSTGAVTPEIKNATVIIYEDEHEYVDLGLPSGTLWAACNVGANSPEEYGNYLAWGETEPKETYNWSTYKWCEGTTDTMMKYCTDSNYGYEDFTDGKTELDPEDDAATAKWGSNWQMPSLAQIDELIDDTYTTTTWMKQNGVYGRLITSKSNGNTLFLPAAGYRGGDSLNNTGIYGYYWSRTLSTSSSGYACALCINSSFFDWYNCSRDFGQSIRPVRKQSLMR